MTPELLKVIMQIPSVDTFLLAKKKADEQRKLQEQEAFRRELKRLSDSISSSIILGDDIWVSADHNFRWSENIRKAADTIVTEMQNIGYTVTLNHSGHNSYFSLEWKVAEPPVYSTSNEK